MEGAEHLAGAVGHEARQDANVLGGRDREQLAVERGALVRLGRTRVRGARLSRLWVFWKPGRQLAEGVAGVGVVREEPDCDAAACACGSGWPGACSRRAMSAQPGSPLEGQREAAVGALDLCAARALAQSRQ